MPKPKPAPSCLPSVLGIGGVLVAVAGALVNVGLCVGLVGALVSVILATALINWCCGQRKT